MRASTKGRQRGTASRSGDYSRLDLSLNVSFATLLRVPGQTCEGASPLRKWNLARSGDPDGAARAAWNHGCSELA